MSGRRGGARVGWAGLVEPLSLREEAPQVRAGLLQLVGVPDDAVAVDQPHQRVGDAWRPVVDRSQAFHACSLSVITTLYAPAPVSAPERPHRSPDGSRVG